MDIKSKIEKGLSSFITTTLDAPHQLCEKFQNIRKTSQAYSKTMNILHNVVAPCAVGACAHYLLPSLVPLPGLSYITSLLPWIAPVPYLNSYCYKDESKTLDDFINYFDQLTKKTELQDINLHPTNFKPSEFHLNNPISYYDCIYAIDSLVNLQSRELFNWHSITGENRAPFEKLRKALIDAPKDDTGTAKKISSEVKEAAQEVIAKIIELKATRAGIKTKAYKNPSLHPRFKELSIALSDLQSELNVGSPKQNTITKIKHLIEITSKTPSIFTQFIYNKDPKVPSALFFIILEKFKLDLEAFEKLPQTLKTCEFLEGNQENLQNKLTEILTNYPKLIHIKPSSQNEVNSAHSPLTQLIDALNFYPNYITTDNTDNKGSLQNHLEQLINTITALYGPDFKDQFLLEIGDNNHPLVDTKPTDPAALRAWGEENLLKATKADFDDTLRALAQKRAIDPNQSTEALIHALFKD